MGKKAKMRSDTLTDDLFAEDKLKTIDLFAGVGGIRKGFEKTEGFETVFSNDFESKLL
jgi:hypothetical protein